MANPNSYTRVQNILQHINTLVIGKRRTWTVEGSGGVPYSLSQNLPGKNESLKDILMDRGPRHFELEHRPYHM